MTNEELIYNLRYCFEKRKTVVGVPWYVWCDRAADALEDAEKRIAELEKELEIWTTRSFEGKIGSMALINLNLKMKISELEAQLPKEGEWIPEGKNLAYCSNCKNCVLRERTGAMFYCPNCGARMMKGEHE